MRWSKLKLRVEEQLAESVRPRTKIFQTVYRRASDSSGEVWLTIDGKRSFSWSDMRALHAERAMYAAGRRAGLSVAEMNDAAPAIMKEGGIHFRWNINVLLLRSLSLPIEAALNHWSPLIRGLAVLDRRCGKRRLVTMKLSGDAPFVRDMLVLRCEAEGLKALAGGNSARNHGQQ